MTNPPQSKNSYIKQINRKEYAKGVKSARGGGRKDRQMNAITQIDKIISFINEYGAITQRDALRFGCARLASRICDLRAAGYEIQTETVKVKNRDGSNSYVASYSWKGERSK